MGIEQEIAHRDIKVIHGLYNKTAHFVGDLENVPQTYIFLYHIYNS